MNLNQLKRVMQSSVLVSMSALLMVACNDEKSANSSTPGSAEADTATSTTTPVVARKKKGRASTKMEADDATVKMEKDKMGYYNRTEVLPAFSGGQGGMEDYINNNIEYPQDAIDNNAEGVVQVRFGVDENGAVSNVSTVGPKIGYGLEEEAIRVVSKMPKWTAGQIKGKNVKAWRTLPINYKLEEQ